MNRQPPHLVQFGRNIKPISKINTHPLPGNCYTERIQDIETTSQENSVYEKTEITRSHRSVYMDAELSQTTEHCEEQSQKNDNSNSQGNYGDTNLNGNTEYEHRKNFSRGSVEETAGGRYSPGENNQWKDSRKES